MYIPKKLITQRYYVAIRETKAFSSWASLEDALECIERFKEHAPHEFLEIKGVICVTEAGRKWVVSDKLKNLINP